MVFEQAPENQLSSLKYKLIIVLMTITNITSLIQYCISLYITDCDRNKYFYFAIYSVLQDIFWAFFIIYSRSRSMIAYINKEN